MSALHTNGRPNGHSDGAARAHGWEGLVASLVLAERALTSQLSFAAATRDEPLGIELPPYVGGQALAPEVISVVASVYLFAELEEAGVVAVADALARRRYELRLPVTSAGSLERYALDMRDMPPRQQREDLHARLFGIGRSASLERGGNHGFLQHTASLCSALVQIGDESAFQLRPSATADARVRHAAGALLAGLLPHTSGDVVWTAKRCHAQLARALELLTDPALGSALGGARGLAGVIRAVAGSDTPDVEGAIGRGRAGQALLLWLRAVTPQLAAGPAATSLVAGDASVIPEASRWLVGVGCTPGAICRPSRGAARGVA